MIHGMTVSYQWQLQKRKRYRFTVLLLALALLLWFAQLGIGHWWSWAVALGFAAASVRWLVDHRACIDDATGTFTREKLLLGRYRIGARRLALTEFTGVALDRRDDREGGSTYYVCLRQRSGELLHVCRIDGRAGERCDAAENTARELAGLTRLDFEEA
jgi:hypothetical protein